MMKEEKIRIENSADLYKLPIQVIKNTKMYNFEGKYYDKIYEEALKIERSGGNVEEIFKPKILISKIEFEMNYMTEFGQKIVICGSTPEMGNWDIKKALVLTWSEGNLWTAHIPMSDSFEYKFVLFEHDKVKKWEGKENRSFNLNEVTTLLQSAELNKENETIRIEGKLPETYVYDHKTSTLKIVCQWR